MNFHRALGCAAVLIAIAGCADDKSETTASTTSTLPPTECATTTGPEDRVVSVTVDDVVAGFGSMSMRANSDLTPGIIRIEVIGDPENAGPVNVTVLFDDVPVATIDGVAAGATCGIDFEVGAGTYHLTDGEHDVDFTVGV